jgi:hypothetical protein
MWMSSRGQGPDRQFGGLILKFLSTVLIVEEARSIRRMHFQSHIGLCELAKARIDGTRAY